MPRPLSLSIISVFAILYGLLSLVPKIMLVTSLEEDGWNRGVIESMSGSGPVPLPPSIHVSHLFASSIVWIASGVFLWKGKNWSRWLMAVWGATVLFLTFSVYGLAGSFFRKAGVYALLLGFLFSPGASRYLRAHEGLDSRPLEG